jgi:hypothetical protein
MDLAMHLGMTTDHMTQSMTEAELNRWARYASSHGLPYKRIEVLLAQVSLLIAKTMGGAKNVKVEDFMLRARKEELPANVTRIEVKRAAFGWNPHNKRKA